MKDFLSAMKFFPRRHFTVMILVTAAWVAASCAPRPPYRMPPPPAGSAPTISRAPQPAPPPTEESFRRPVPQEGKIREQDLKSKGNLPSSSAKESSRETSLGENRAAEPVTPPLADDSSLLAKITPATPPQRAASLRLTEEGRKLLDAGDPQKALTRLEKTIVIDSTNAYGYFYLAKTQYRLGRYKESLNFLDVTESQLSNKEPFWLAEVHALRGENYRALGMLQKAEASYVQALRLNSGNRTAGEAMSRLQADSQPASR